MKTINVDHAELVKYIAQNCPSYFYNYVDGECCRRKVDKEVCSLHAFSDALHCPPDCPRLHAKEYGCDKGRCARVKNIIKGLKAKEVPKP